MQFKNFNEEEYGQDLLIETVCEIHFPIIMKISSELPSDFHDIVRRAGYLEFIEDLRPSTHNIFDPTQRQQIIFQFTDERDSRIRLSDTSLSLSFTKAYIDSENFKNNLIAVLSNFIQIYQPAFFSRISLSCMYVAANSFLQDVELKVKDFVPDHIFSDFESNIIEDVTCLTKTSSFFEDNFGFNIRHAIDNLSGSSAKGQLNKETCYLIDIECFYNSFLGEINDVSNKFDAISRFRRGIFHWSISEILRRIITE